MLKDKISYFEYFVSKVYQQTNVQGKNDLSKLKLFKLHFLVSAINTNDKNEGLLDVFDKFYALPLGPVEGDIYDNLQNLCYFKIDSERTEIKAEIKFEGLDNNITNRIDSQFDILIEQNKSILHLAPMDLVEITHKWDAWRIAFNNARKEHKYSRPMTSELIKLSNKVYTIN